MDEFGNCLSVTQLSLTDKKVAQHYTTPLYTHPPQPAVDARAWLLSRGMWPEQLSSRINLGDTAQAPTMLELFTEFAAKSAAPVDPSTKAEPYRVEWSGENRTARVVGPKFTGPWKKEASAVHQCADMNQAFAQGGTKATVNPPKVLTDEAMEQAAMDSMAQVVDGKRTYDHDPGSHAWEAFKSGLRYARDNGYLAPAKVDVDAVARELHGAMVAKGIKFSDEGPLPFEDDFRARLTKLFNA
jgi:hypothetical protein